MNALLQEEGGILKRLNGFPWPRSEEVVLSRSEGPGRPVAGAKM